MIECYVQSLFQLIRNHSVLIVRERRQRRLYASEKSKANIFKKKSKTMREEAIMLYIRHLFSALIYWKEEGKKEKEDR